MPSGYGVCVLIGVGVPSGFLFPAGSAVPVFGRDVRHYIARIAIEHDLNTQPPVPPTVFLFLYSKRGVMNVLPFELLGAVAGELDSQRDLTSFRLVSHVCAAAALPLLAQHIAVLNTAGSLDELCSFLQSHAYFARHVTHLSVYHGSWPHCTREAWEMHPLLLAGNARISVETARENSGADEAFEDYR